MWSRFKYKHSLAIFSFLFSISTIYHFYFYKLNLQTIDTNPGVNYDTIIFTNLSTKHGAKPGGNYGTKPSTKYGTNLSTLNNCKFMPSLVPNFPTQLEINLL